MENIAIGVVESLPPDNNNNQLRKSQEDLLYV